MHAHAAVASVQARSHFAVFGSIALHIGVEQKKIAATHLHAPHLGVNGSVTGIDLHHDGTPVFSDGRFHGKLADIGLEVFFMLPAVAIKALAEISLAVKQAHSDKWNSEIG